MCHLELHGTKAVLVEARLKRPHLFTSKPARLPNLLAGTRRPLSQPTTATTMKMLIPGSRPTHLQRASHHHQLSPFMKTFTQRLMVLAAQPNQKDRHSPQSLSEELTLAGILTLRPRCPTSKALLAEDPCLRPNIIISSNSNSSVRTCS